jgi:hypothetical protein
MKRIFNVIASEARQSHMNELLIRAAKRRGNPLEQNEVIKEISFYEIATLPSVVRNDTFAFNIITKRVT